MTKHKGSRAPRVQRPVPVPCSAGWKSGRPKKRVSTKAPSPQTRRRTNMPEPCIPSQA
jgi:hypothetical protein